jgi:hypothetical protein
LPLTVVINRPYFANTDRSNFSTVYDDNGIDFLGIPDFPEIQMDNPPNVKYYDLSETEKLRFDIVAYNFYNDPYMFWLILHVNGIINPYDVDTNISLRIPSYLSYLAALMRFGL